MPTSQQETTRSPLVRRRRRSEQLQADDTRQVSPCKRHGKTPNQYQHHSRGQPWTSSGSTRRRVCPDVLCAEQTFARSRMPDRKRQNGRKVDLVRHSCNGGLRAAVVETVAPERREASFCISFRLDFAHDNVSVAHRHQGQLQIEAVAVLVGPGSTDLGPVAGITADLAHGIDAMGGPLRFQRRSWYVLSALRSPG